MNNLITHVGEVVLVQITFVIFHYLQRSRVMVQTLLCFFTFISNIQHITRTYLPMNSTNNEDQFLKEAG